MSSERTDRADRITSLKALAIPLCAAVLAHFWAIRDLFVNFDVHVFLLRNPLTTDPFGGGWFELVATPDLGYPIPVTVLGYAVQRALFGLEPLGYHIVSVGLHVLVVGLVFVLARRLGARAMVAAALATIFAIHPLTVEPVAWVVGQKDLIATLLILGALIIRAHPNGDSRSRTALVFALSVLALFSKPSAVCVPLLLIFIDWACDRRLKRNLVLYVPTAVLAALVIGLSIWSHENYTATGVSRAFNIYSFLDAAWAVSLQTLHVFAPADLTPRYFEPRGVVLFAGAALGLLITVGLLVLIVRAARAGDRLTAAGLLLFGAAYGPVAGIVPITRGPADSYMYLPLALLAATMGPAIGRFVDRSRRLALILFGSAAVALFALSAAAHHNWSSSRALWSALIDKYPTHPVPKLRMAQTFIYERKIDLALAALEQIEKDFAPGYVNHRWFWGDTLSITGRQQEADRIYTLAAAERERFELERYGRFLVKNDVTPTNPELAAAAIRQVGPKLVDSNAHPWILGRAAFLADAAGETELANALRERQKTVIPRSPP